MKNSPSRPNADRAPLPVQSTRQPTVEEIRRRAFEIYCARRGGPGDAASDWLEAERQLRAGIGAPRTQG